MNARSSAGYTSLHLAVSSGSAECVRVLIECGADTAAKDDYGKTPEMIAVLGGRTRVLKIYKSEGMCTIIIMMYKLMHE